MVLALESGIPPSTWVTEEHSTPGVIATALEIMQENNDT